MLIGAFLTLFKLKGKALDWTVLGVTILTFVFTLVAVMGQDSTLTILKTTDTLVTFFKVDDVGRMFSLLSAFMWILAIMYSFEYMDHEGHKTRFYSFMLLTLGPAVALPLAGNMFTMYMAYELLTLLSMPLVIHSFKPEAMQAAKKYLAFSFFGAGLVLSGTLVMTHFSNSLDFVAGGNLDMAKVSQNPTLILTMALLMFVGFSVKAGMFPLHAWLPSAHPVAPAPASALLSGVITKAGVVAIIRVLFFVFGVDFIAGTWVQNLLIVITLCSVFLGSMMAFKEQHFKRRLAYSSVSQLSYVLFGIIVMSSTGMTGALMHVIAHAAIKITLFFVAGVMIIKLEAHDVEELKGVGKSMPITMWCFTLCSLGLVGIPPTTGYVSKWFLAQGSLGMGNQVLAFAGPIVLLVSAILTAGYLISIFIDAFFPGKDFDYSTVKKLEPSWTTLTPMLILTAVTLIAGMFPGGLLNFFSNITKILF